MYKLFHEDFFSIVGTNPVRTCVIIHGYGNFKDIILCKIRLDHLTSNIIIAEKNKTMKTETNKQNHLSITGALNSQCC